VSNWLLKGAAHSLGAAILSGLDLLFVWILIELLGMEFKWAALFGILYAMQWIYLREND